MVHKALAVPKNTGDDVEENPGLTCDQAHFLASPICSLMSSLAKIGPDEKSLKNSGRSAKFWPTKLVI